MSRYSKVRRGVWNDPKLRSLGPPPAHPQTLYLRLTTGPELSQIPGLFTAWEAGLAQALGWSLDDFRTCFQSLSDLGLVVADWRVGLVYLPGIAAEEQNHPQSPNVVLSWKTTLDELPECELLETAKDELRRVVTLVGPAFEKALRTALGEAPSEASTMASGKPSSKPLPKPRESLPGSLPDSLPGSLGEGLGEAFAKAMPNQEQDTRTRLKSGVTRPVQPHDNLVLSSSSTRARAREPDTTTTTGASLGRISCPKDLALTLDQRATLETSMLIPGWAIDRMTAEFVAINLADPGRRDTLTGWRKLLVKSAQRIWHDSRLRPKRPPDVADIDARRAADQDIRDRLDATRQAELRKAQDAIDATALGDVAAGGGS